MASNDLSSSFRVVIVGGGVAGLEAALALRELAGGRVAVRLVAPEPEFVYRPMRVREPFASGAARHYSLGEIAADLGVELVKDGFGGLEPEQRVVRTEGGVALS